jgi:hypothetical protein
VLLLGLTGATAAALGLTWLARTPLVRSRRRVARAVR